MSQTALRPAPDRRVALITDIHGHLPGLLAVLGVIKSHGIEKIICLGDLVDGGEQNAEVIRELRTREIPCLRGNHDENPMSRLSPGDRAWLAALPESLVFDDAVLTHISPLPDARKLSTGMEARRVFDATPHRIVFVGHVHYPVIFGDRGGAPGDARVHLYEIGRPVCLDPSDRWIMVVGPIGYSRDLFPYPRYAIWDPVNHTVEMRAVKVPLLRIGPGLLDW